MPRFIFLFTVTKEHIALLKQMRVGWENNRSDPTHPGAPAIKRFRTYGNADVYGDIADLLEMPPMYQENRTQPQKERMDRIHRETQIALQIFLIFGSMDEGTYSSPYPDFFPHSTALLSEEQLQQMHAFAREHPEQLHLVTLTAKKIEGTVDFLAPGENEQFSEER